MALAGDSCVPLSSPPSILEKTSWLRPHLERGALLELDGDSTASLSPSLSSCSCSFSLLFCQNSAVSESVAARLRAETLPRRRRTFIFLRCFTLGTFLLAGRTILSALIHSSYLRTKIKGQHKRPFHEEDLKEPLTAGSTRTPGPSGPSRF